MNDREPVLGALNRIQTAAIAAAVIGIVLCALAAMQSLEDFYRAYLFGYIFWSNITLGCFAVGIIAYMTKSAWGIPILRLLEAGMRNLWLMLLLFVPIILAVATQHLYPWAKPASDFADLSMRHGVENKAHYMALPWFTLRTIVYFAVWIGLMTVLTRSSARQDKTRNPREREMRSSIAGPGAVLYVLTLTFASTDWVMSLDPRWASTLWGFWFVIGQGLGATALVIFLVTRLAALRPFSDVVTPAMARDLGNVLLTFTMFWGYFAISQFLIIYSGNLPDEITYYAARGLSPTPSMSGISYYWYLATIIVILQFFAPFTALLSGRTKRTIQILGNLALGILAVRVLDIYWTVIPFFYPAGAEAGLSVLWKCLGAFLALGGIWLALFCANMKRYPFLPEPAADVVPEGALEHA